jgi:hypothetical protein
MPQLHHMGEILARDRVRRRRRGESGANRYHTLNAGDAIIARTVHERSVRGSSCAPYTIERYRGRRQHEIH